MSVDTGIFEQMLAGMGPAGKPAAPSSLPPQPAGPVRWDLLEEEPSIEIDLDPAQDAKLRSFLRTEIERSNRFLQLEWGEIRKDRDQYGEIKKPKSFPWENCSNIAVAMTHPLTNQIVGFLYRALRGSSPAIQTLPLPGISSEFAEPDMVAAIQDFLNAKMISDPTFFASLCEWVMETAITGTGVSKVYWSEKDRKFKEYKVGSGEYGGSIPYVSEGSESFAGTRLDQIRTEDFLLPPEATNNQNAVEEAQWVAQRYRERWGEAAAKADAGIYKWSVVRQLYGQADQTESGNSVLVDPVELRDVRGGPIEQPGDKSANELILYEVWARVPLTEGSQEEDCVLVYSYRHDKILAAKKLPLFHGDRPFSVMRYWALPNRFFGRGVPRQLRHSQKANDDLVNAMLDNATLVTTPIIVSGKQTGIKPGKNDRIWPGRWLTLDDPKDFQAVQFPAPPPQIIEISAQIDALGQRAAGVSPAIQGMDSGDGSRETAAGAMSRAGSASPMFDVILDNMRRAIARVAELYLSTYQQYRPQRDAYLIAASDGQLVEKYLELPPSSVVGKYRFHITATSASANPEIRKMSLQHLLATMQPIAQELMAIVGQMGDPSVPPAVLEVMKHNLHVKVDISRQMLQAFEIPSAADAIPPWGEFWQKLEPVIMQTRQQATGQPPKLADTIARKLGPGFRELQPSEQIQVLEMLGVQASEGRQALAKIEADAAGGQSSGGAGGPMGQADAQGAGGVPGAPPQMPGVPLPG